MRPNKATSDLVLAMPPHPSGFNKRLRKPRISPFFLRFTDRKKKEAERRQAPGKTTSAPSGAAACPDPLLLSRLRGRSGGGARPPIGVPPRLSPEGRPSQRLSSRPRFLGRRSCGCYPPLPCPSPVTAPHAPAVVPARKMPGAARERTVSVRPQAPHSLHFPEYLRERRPSNERDVAPVCQRGNDVKKFVRRVNYVGKSRGCET